MMDSKIGPGEWPWLEARRGLRRFAADNDDNPKRARAPSVMWERRSSWSSGSLQVSPIGLLRREAVEQARTSGRDQVLLAAGARHVRGVPGALVHRVGDALAVVVADQRLAEGAARPVVAGHVDVGRKRAAVHLRAGQDVVLVGRVAAALDHLALLVQRRLLVDLGVVAMQILDVLRDHHALGIVPGTAADAIARIDRRGARRRKVAEIG